MEFDDGGGSGAAPLAPTAEEEKLDPIWGWCEHGRSAVECPEPHPMMNIDDLIQRINGALNEPMGRGDERRVRKVLLAALASPPSAPAASGAPPHDAAEELTCLREMYQDALRDMDKMLADFAAALGLPDPIHGTESPGHPHILAAINALRAGPVPEFVEHLGAHDGPCDNTEVCTECGQSKGGCGVHGENFMRRRKAALAALSPQASAPEGPAAGTTEEE